MNSGYNLNIFDGSLFLNKKGDKEANGCKKEGW